MFFLRLGLVVLLTLIVLAGAFLAFSKTLTGENYLQEFVLEQLEESLGRQIDVGHVKFVMFPPLGVELSEVAIHDPESERVVLTAKRVTMVVRLLPLFRKQIVGKRLVIEEPTLTLRRNEEGRWNVLETLNEQAEMDQRTMEAMVRIFMIRQVTLVNGTVTVIDAARPDGVRTMTLEQVESKLLIHPDRGVADLHISGNPSEIPGASTVVLDGVIRQGEKPVSLSGTTPEEPDLLFQFDGHLDASALDIRDVVDFLGTRPIPQDLHGTVAVQGDVQIMPGVAGYDLVLSEMTAAINGMELSGKANLAGLMTPHPTFAVTFNSSLVSLSQVIKTVPAGWIDPWIMDVVADRRIDGKVQVLHAAVTGSAAEEARLSATGEFRVQEARALIGPNRVASTNLAGRVFVEPGRIRVAEITGKYGAIQLTDGKAVVSFLEGRPWLELDVTGSMAAAQLLESLAKTVRNDQFTQTLASLTDVDGMTRPTFRLAGAMDQPGGIQFAGGEISAHSVGFNHPALPERVTGLQGRFILNAGATQFDQVTGRLGDAEIEVQGTMTGGETSRFQDFSVRVYGAVESIVRLIPMSTPPEAFEGRAVATVSLSGRTVAPHLRGVLVLDESKVMFPGLGEKPVGAPATVEFEGEVTTANVLAVNRLKLMLPAVEVAAKGRMLFGDQVKVNGSVVTGTLSLSQLPQWVTMGGIKEGKFEVSLDIKGKGTDWHAWQITGWAALTDGVLPTGGDIGALYDIYARVKFVHNGAEIKQLTFNMGDSDVAIEASVKNWGTQPLITGKIESKHMDLLLLVPSGNRSPMREFLETLAEHGQTTLSLAIAQGRYHHVTVEGLSARVTIRERTLDIDRITGGIGEGQVAGRLVSRLPKNAPAEVDLSFRTTSLPVEDWLQLAGTPVHSMTGDMRLSGAIRGHGRNPHGVYPSLNGKVDVLLENGHIFKSDERTIWKIISLLNVPAVLQGKVDLEKEGLPYNKIAGTVTVKDGVFHTENLVIDSPILKITAVGHYDLPTDQLDLVTAVSPFGSYSKFLKAIPLFGRILGGERKGLATAIFSVQGVIKDPEVTYLPVKSFASGLSGLAQLAVDVLTNTLTLPLDLVAPDEGERQSGAETRMFEQAPAPPL